MGRILTVSFVLFVAVFSPHLRAQEYSQYEPFSPEQLDNLLAPIALYPDPLLAQVLVAATFPDQIDEASRFVRSYRNADDLDGQWWDVSVKAVAHYPTVLAMMADKLDWTSALGQAYAYQSTDVMTAIQRLRVQARRAGNLYSTPEIQVVDSGGEIQLWPGQPQYIYVPRYDPAVVFFYRAPLFFGPRFFIGAWLNFDFDWGGHRVFYHGWEAGRGGWIDRSRQYIHPNNFYVNNTYRNVVINRPVIRRPLNYSALNRYDDVHRATNFNNFRGNTRVVNPPNFGVTNRVINQPPTPPIHGPVPNKIITRNFDTTNPRINDYRGHVTQPAAQVHVPVAPAFNPVRGNFDPRVTSVRGRTSRALVRSTPPPVVRRNVVKQPVHPPANQKKDKNDGNKH
ncbi:MAG: DUF3300 domain-containing protein [Acidobacteriia bacterium]|nr:DUF3300 domain-containing protein [Terriglobia bacterium]